MVLHIIAATANVCSLAASPSCGPSTPNLIVNGGFDALDLSGWNATCADADCMIEPDPSGQSGQLREVFGVKSILNLSQTVQLQPGRYQLDFAFRDSTIPLLSQYNSVNLLLNNRGVDTYLNDLAATGSYYGSEAIVTHGGPLEVTFYLLIEHPSFDVDTATIVIDDIYLYQLDDAGAAQGANASLAASRNGAHRFIDTIFSAPGTGDTRLAARPIATAVAGPTLVQTGKTHAWVSGGYAKASWDDHSAHARDSAVSGGIETNTGDGWSAGFAASIVDRDTDAGDTLSILESAGQSASFALYANWASGSGDTFVRGTVGGGLSSRDQTRFVAFDPSPIVADDIDGAHWFSSIETGLNFQLAPSIGLSPYLRATGLQVREDGFAEINTGGGPSASAVAASTQDSLTSQAGARLSISSLLDPSILLELHAAWRHEFLDQNNVLLSYPDASGPAVSIFGGTVLAPALREGRDSGVIGAALDVTHWHQTSIFVRYDGELGDSFSAHSGQAGIRAVW